MSKLKHREHLLIHQTNLHLPFLSRYESPPIRSFIGCALYESLDKKRLCQLTELVVKQITYPKLVPRFSVWIVWYMCQESSRKSSTGEWLPLTSTWRTPESSSVTKWRPPYRRHHYGSVWFPQGTQAWRAEELETSWTVSVVHDLDAVFWRR